MTGLRVIHHSTLLPLLIVPQIPLKHIQTYITLTFVTLPHSHPPPPPFLGPGMFEKILDPPLHNKGILLVDVFISVAAVEKHDELKTQNQPK